MLPVRHGDVEPPQTGSTPIGDRDETQYDVIEGDGWIAISIMLNGQIGASGP